VSQNIVAKYPASDLQVYVVWVNQRVTDERDAISVSTVPGARHYWDDDWATGRWLAEKDLGGLGYTGAVYDVYYFFDGEATWDDVPGRSSRPARPSTTRATGSPRRPSASSASGTRGP
jgi:hypothetical protein